MNEVRNVLLALILLFAPQLAAAQSFPPLSGRVVDAANMLDAGQKAQVEALSIDVGKVANRQLVVATIPDLQGYAIEDYGYKLGRAWGIGQKDASNGIILIVAPNERKVRIEVGYGLEPVMTDALARTIIANRILPQFRAGDMPGGIVAGAQAIAEQMKLPPEAAEARAATEVAGSRAQRNSSGNGAMILGFIVLLLVFIVLPIMFGRAKGKRYRSGRSPVVIWGPGLGNDWGSGSGSSWSSGSNWGSSGGSDWGGGGGFSGGGGSFGGGGASGSW